VPFDERLPPNEAKQMEEFVMLGSASAGRMDRFRGGFPAVLGTAVSLRVLASCVALLTVIPAPIFAGQEGIAIPTGQKQLFLDDYIIAETQNLERTLHQPAKYEGNPVLQPGYRWENVCIQSRTPPVWIPDEKVWKIWYIGSATGWGDEAPGGGRCYAVSRDGINWEKPFLRQVEYHGSRENNILSRAVDMVVYDAREPNPERRYKGLSPLPLQPVVSADGIHWTALDVPPIPSSDEYFMTFDETTGRYLATVKHGGPHGRAMFLSTSTDFEHWTEPVLIFAADERDQELGRQRIEEAIADPNRVVPAPANVVREKYNTDVYNMAVFPYEGLYIGLPCIFDQTGPSPDGNQDGFLYVELTCSRDLHHWTRVGERGVFIGSGPKGSYDSGMILATGRPIVRENELWFYYNGFTVTHSADVQPNQGAICLAKLRLDGFVSLDAGEQVGTLLTKPLRIDGKRLFVNLDAPEGEVRAEVLDAAGRPVAGFDSRRCVPATGDHLRAEIRWEGGADLASLAGEDIRLRFTVRRGSLYAFWFE